jgi:putative SOS response-associated peptidase YedK
VCGRYSLASSAEELVEAFDVPDLAFELAPSWNIAPGQLCPVVAEDRRGRRIGLLTWGFVPRGRSAAGRGFVNARAESVAKAAAFRDAFRSRRCLIPADGFYEWRRADGAKIPFWLHPRQGGIVSFAGIWERWSPPGRPARHGFAILTVDASDDVRDIHDRMPAVVGEGERGAWLATASRPEDVQEILRPAAAGTFAARPVSARVNSSANDGPDLVEPLDP